jgi:AraC-like DNA-binding protein
MLIPDGFPGQRLRVLPQPLIKAALDAPVTERMLVTDAGHFPHAAAHGRSRPHGAREAIVMLCTGGTGWLTIDGITRRVSSGEAAVIPAETPHLYRADERDPWTIWWLHADGTDVAQLVEVIVGADRDPIVPVRDIYTAVGFVEQAVAAFENDETTASLYVAAGAAWRLLSQLASDRLRGPAATADRIHIVQDFLRSNLAATTSVSELARLAGLSTSHFSALFKASAGIGVVEYVRRLRSARARELLITTDAPIADIALSVGYADAFYFSRQFRLVNGTSPSEYRTRAHRDAI